ncbi:MAG: serine/threonine-protein kinase [Gammaproteobacteria bacterium]|nr:serine/threonine-protein kinase [Gammaproteobacteria bacterium]
MKKGFWTTDWFFGVIVSLVFFLLAYVIYADVFQGVERSAYDLGMRASESTPSERIAIIEIDDASIETIGRWPWPRSLQAEMIANLSDAGAKVIGSTVFFSEPQEDPGLLVVNDLAAFYDRSSLGENAPFALPEAPTEASEDGSMLDEENLEGLDAETRAAIAEAAAAADKVVGGDDSVMPEEEDVADPANVTDEPPADAEPSEAGDAVDELRIEVVPETLVSDLTELRGRLESARNQLNTDAQLAAAMRAAGNVVLPMTMTEPNPIGNPDSDLPPWLMENAIFNVEGNGYTAASFGGIQPPIEPLAKAAEGIGHLMLFPDVDGSIRYEALALEYYDIPFPSFAMTVAARSLNLTNEDMMLRFGQGVQLGRLNIGTTPDMLMYNYYYDPESGNNAFTHYSFVDVMQGIVPLDRFSDKIVLIGATALGVGDSFPTPVSPNMAPVTQVAHTVSAILQEDFFTRPDWANSAELAVFALIALYLILLLPRMRPGIGALVSLALLIAMFLAEFTLLTGSNMWLKLMVPMLFLITGHLLVTIKMFRVTEKIRIRSEAEGAESNRMLGLAFQGQGQLDMAFEKFRKTPMDDSVMDLLYNLALDYERKRQHNKAGAVYQYMAEYNPDYKDLKKRMKRSKAMEETVMLGGGGGSHPGGTLMLDGDDEVQKPMLGRYQVEKELGKGAMGVVYLGRDPKINRVVAIKTMALSQEFEEDELEEVTERFFREAETAGRLNHPHIVTIYDAGEEHDLAYIAMEFLKGKDLTGHTKPDKLLPTRTVFDIIAKSADALDFAHQQNVVHRDIKPANLMFDEESGELKITDFGIARITDSSKTKTGMVLGTPSYMSPEQLQGAKVDGRSDLFSLGVTFYQMLCGQLPFKADSMATLMYKIANEDHAPLTLVRPELPSCVDDIINKAMDKDADKRFQTGKEMAAAIRECEKHLAD